MKRLYRLEDLLYLFWTRATGTISKSNFGRMMKDGS